MAMCPDIMAGGSYCCMAMCPDITQSLVRCNNKIWLEGAIVVWPCVQT